jgi:hypothetical protein
MSQLFHPATRSLTSHLGALLFEVGDAPQEQRMHYQDTMAYAGYSPSHKLHSFLVHDWINNILAAVKESAAKGG